MSADQFSPEELRAMVCGLTVPRPGEVYQRGIELMRVHKVFKHCVRLHAYWAHFGGSVSCYTLSFELEWWGAFVYTGTIKHVSSEKWIPPKNKRSFARLRVRST